MLTKIVFLVAACHLASAATSVTSGATSISNTYEEKNTYRYNRQCRPSLLDKGIQCSAIGASTPVVGGIFDTFGQEYVSLASAYYVARIADAQGYQAQCPTNVTFLKELDLVDYWSGKNGAIALGKNFEVETLTIMPHRQTHCYDTTCGYQRLDTRVCQWPNGTWPFLCKGGVGTPGTYASRLGSISYTSALQGPNNNWVLFLICFNPKTPTNLNAVGTATGFMVLNTLPVLPAAEKTQIIDKLASLGFNTQPSNIIDFDFSSTNCNF